MFIEKWAQKKSLIDKVQNLQAGFTSWRQLRKYFVQWTVKIQNWMTRIKTRKVFQEICPYWSRFARINEFLVAYCLLHRRILLVWEQSTGIEIVKWNIIAFKRTKYPDVGFSKAKIFWKFFVTILEPELQPRIQTQKIFKMWNLLVRAQKFLKQAERYHVI